MNRIEELIKEKGYNMTSFAEVLGVSRQNLYQTLKSPSYPTLERIAETLHVQLWELFISSDKVISGDKENVLICPNCGAKLELRIKEEKEKASE